jgi:hypothetical protein
VAFEGGLTSPDGSAWLVGDEQWPQNPQHAVAPPWHDFVRLWLSCHAGMGGVAHWPDAGGVVDQSAWVVDAFGILAGLNNKLDEDERRRRGR